MASFHLLYIHLCFLVVFLISSIQFPITIRGCNEEDRRALLNFKSSLKDISNRLSSWQEGKQHENCCNWYGIGCSNISSRVISIDLRNKELESYFQVSDMSTSDVYDPPSTSLTGIFPSSLLKVTQLEYLDLAFNDFQGSKIPLQFSGLTKLVHLDFSCSNLTSLILTQFSNISSLQYLDLSCLFGNFLTGCLESSSTKWLRGLVNLRVLRLIGIDLYEATSSEENIGKHISFLSNLRKLDLSYCSISTGVFPIHEYHNLSRLSSLKMNNNYELNSTFPIQLGNFTSLSILELDHCGLIGLVPNLRQLTQVDVSQNYHLHLDLTNMFKLQKLLISYNGVSGPILPWISNASALIRVDASGCSIHGDLPSSLFNLSNQLQYLKLADNSITGAIPSSISNLKHLYYLNLARNRIQGLIPNSICEIFPLQKLVLDNNNITGNVPSCIKQLKNHSYFTVSNTSIRGNISLNSLLNNSNLTYLVLSYNMQLTVAIDQHLNLYPNHKLKRLWLTSTNLQGSLRFICNLTGLVELDLSRTNLSGTIPSCIFKLRYLTELRLANNMLSGILPLPPQGISIFHVSNNSLSGEISIETGKRLSKCESILLSGNEFSGSIPYSIFPTETALDSKKFSLGFLDLSNNKLSGSIPTNIWRGSTLASLNLGTNNLTGIVPKELRFATKLRTLLLYNNHLSGTINFISALHNLEYLNLADNNFGGSIPTAIGSLQNLTILSLRSNKLTGTIPKEIIHLQKLCILDLSLNNLSGGIPTKLGNLTGLITSGSCHYGFTGFGSYGSNRLSLLTKGIMVQVKRVYDYSSVVDLSCNALEGNLPKDITLVKALSSLNLSHNQFSNDIPENIGNLSALESLDLSSNILSGHIPKSLTTIDTLGVLNLSYNKLSGQIPRGTHFDTLCLDGVAFAGNDLLCGFPTVKLCKGDHNTNASVDNSSNEKYGLKDKLLLYAIVALGFGVGFWGLFLVLILKKERWWFNYWRFVNNISLRITNYFQNIWL